MITVKFDFNLNKINELLRAYPKEAHDAAERQLKKAALDLQGKAQKIAPKDLADLRGSAYSHVSGKMIKAPSADSEPGSERFPVLVSADLEAIIGFTEPYALIQHESLNFQHTDGEAKYLEKPYLENKEKYIDSVGAAIKKALEEAAKGGSA